jgi:hypothetical protein
MNVSLKIERTLAPLGLGFAAGSDLGVSVLGGGSGFFCFFA